MTDVKPTPDPTALEHAWREYTQRATGRPWQEDVVYGYIEPSRDSWLAGYAAGAGYALSAIKKLVEPDLRQRPAGEDS